MPARAPVRLPEWAERLLAVARVDWEPPTRQPTAGRVVLATLLALAGSLLADALLVALGTHLFPSTRGFVHFRPTDYGALTTVGVLAACAGWPIVTRVTSAPRWLFFRLAILVTLALLLPDAWILLRGEPSKAVAVLVSMHLAIALVTYNVLVYVAPAGRRRTVPARPAAGRAPTMRSDRGRQAPADGSRAAAEPARDTAYPPDPVEPAYGPDGVAIAVPVAVPVGSGTTAYPATSGRTGATRPAVVTPVVPLRPKAAPPVGGSTGDGAFGDPVPRAQRVPVVRRLEPGPLPEPAGTRGSGGGRSGGDATGDDEHRPGRGSRAERRPANVARPPAANVARPPATLAEPRSAVRLLPPAGEAGTEPMTATPGHAAPFEPTVSGEAGGAGAARFGGRHARPTAGGGAGEPGDDRAGGGTGRTDGTGRWRRGQRGRHVARP